MPVYDFRDATPPVLFVCDLENIFVDRGRGFSQPWLRYWFSVRVEIVDENYGEVPALLGFGEGEFGDEGFGE